MTLPTGTVTGWFSARRVDSDESVPLSGSLEFTPLDRYTVDLDSGVAGVMFSRPVTISLDAFGWISEAGVREVELLAGRYVVTPSLFLDGDPYDLRAYSITVPADGNVEIARETPSPDAGDVPAFRGLPAGGDVGDVLIRTGPGNYEVGWATTGLTPPPTPAGGTVTRIATPAATWTLAIPTDLGRLPVVTLYDDGGRQLWTDPPSVSDTTVTVMFARPQSGYAVIS